MKFFDVERARIWVFWRRVLHTAHHRTQLTVYLRLLDRPVPPIYGPTADVTWSDADHVRLRDALKHKNNWVMSYDDHPRIRELYPTLAFHMAVKYSGASRGKEPTNYCCRPVWSSRPTSIQS